METTAERDAKFHQELGGDLKAAGHPTETVPPQEQPVLGKGIELPDIDIIPEGMHKLVHGEGPQTFVGGTAGENWRTRLKQRILGKWRSLRHREIA